MDSDHELGVARLLIAEILGEQEVVAYRPGLARALGSPLAALFLCQALYWQSRAGENSFWFKLRDAKTDCNGVKIPPADAFSQSWEWELGMSRSEQETARKILKRHGLLVESLRGVPAKLHYKVNLSNVYDFLVGSILPVSRRQPPQLAESCQLDGKILLTSRNDSADKQAALPQLAGRKLPTKERTEITPETTSKNKHTTTTTDSQNEISELIEMNEYLSKKLLLSEKKAISILLKDIDELDKVNLLDELANAIQKRKIKSNMFGWFSVLVQSKKNGTFTSSLESQLTKNKATQSREVKKSIEVHERKIRQQLSGLPSGGSDNLKMSLSLLKGVQT